MSKISTEDYFIETFDKKICVIQLQYFFTQQKRLHQQPHTKPVEVHIGNWLKFYDSKSATEDLT